MKRKLPLLLAMLILVQLFCIPVAQAAYAPSIGGENVVIDDPDVPLVELPEIRIVVDPDDAGYASVPEDEFLDAIQKVVDGEAIRITIVPKEGETLSKVALSKDSLQALKDSGAQVMLMTANGRVALSSNALASFDDEIILVIEKEEKFFGNEVGLRVYVLSKNGKISYTWSHEELTLYVPVDAGKFVVGSNYSVKQLDEDGKQIDTHVGLCVEEDDQLWVVITIDSGYLGYFVALPGATSNATAAVNPTIVSSPLVAANHNAKSSMLMSVQHWFDSVANQVMALLGF